jgi:hypothetical protein
VDGNRKKISKHCEVYGFTKSSWPNDKGDFRIALNEFSDQRCFVKKSATSFHNFAEAVPANGNAFSCKESSGSLYDSIEKELVSDMKISW